MRPFGEQSTQAWRGAAWVVITVFSFVLSLSAQQPGKPGMSAQELMRATVQNEIDAVNHSPLKFMFCSRKTTDKKSETHLYVETTQSMAGMLIATDGHPLTAEQKQGEINRLNGIASNPDALRRKHAREKDDTDHSLRILRALPEAFRYEYSEGGGSGTPEVGGTGAELVKLKFTPNPSYAAPSRIEQVLTGMEGFLLIDTHQNRLAEIDGTLFKDVSFGWGIIGRLDKGGRFHVEQADVGGSWEITKMDLSITGKVLIFKSLNFNTKEVFSDFERVPSDTTFAQGVELLKTQEEKLAKSGTPSLAKKAD